VIFEYISIYQQFPQRGEPDREERGRAELVLLGGGGIPTGSAKGKGGAASG